jgi:SecD/SecF fusion protein
MKMNDEGTRKWARITGANIDKQIAIVLDGTVFSAPVVKSKIPNGSSVINGLASAEEARDLEIVLKAGALPAPVRIVEERTVGASLGEDSIRAGLYSVLAGFFVVAIFMILYYRAAGFIADFALVFNVLFVIAFLAGFSATLTLPGIAGLVLTIGMAVDANVLIFERVREEFAKGKMLKLAIEIGYDKAFSAIFDSHVTTFGAAALLYTFGIGPIQGFAVTLMIGIAASLFTAIVITKISFDWMLERDKVSIVSFG